MRAYKKAPLVEATTNEAGSIRPEQGLSFNDSIPQTAPTESLFIRAPEIMELLGVSRSTASRCIAQVNKRMKGKGCFVVAGACNRRAFLEIIGEE